MLTCGICEEEIGVESPTDLERSNEELALQIHRLAHAIEELVNANKEVKK